MIVHMRVRGSGPHDVGAGGLVCSRSPVVFGSNGHRIIQCGPTGKHVGDARDRVSRFRFVSLGISKQLHRRGINTHRRFAYNFKIPRHAGKTVVPLTEHDHLALRVGVDDPCRLRDLCWPADIARAILTCVESSLSVDEL
jgi:hypothetical protein